MKLILQRVKKAEVRVDKKVTGSINEGVMVLAGFGHNDNEEIVKWCSDKLVNLRIFNDENGKMNNSLSDVNGEILLVSQFTLYGDTSRGRRPGYSNAALPETAEKLYNFQTEYLKSLGFNTQNGIFGAHMEVELINDGPVTLIIEKENS